MKDSYDKIENKNKIYVLPMKKNKAKYDAMYI